MTAQMPGSSLASASKGLEGGVTFPAACAGAGVGAGHGTSAIDRLDRLVAGLCARQASVSVVLGGHGLGLIRSLGEKGVRSIVIDDGPVSVRDFSRYCRRITVADISTAPDRLCEILRSLSTLARRYSGRPPIIFPTTDAVLNYIVGRYDEIEELAVIVSPSREALMLTLDKAAFYRRLTGRGFPCPRTVFPSAGPLPGDVDIGGISFPCIVKPSLTFLLEQAEGRKLFVAGSPEELQVCCRDLSERGMRYVVQEIVPGRDEDQYSLAGYCGRGGEIVGYVMTNKLRQSHFGAGTFVSGAHVPPLLALGRRLLKDLDYRGIFEIEFRRDERDGTYRIIELNPRCWSQIMLATRMGVNAAYHAYQDLVGTLSGGERQAPRDAKKYWIDLERDLGNLKRKWKQGDYSLRDVLSVMSTIPIIEPFNLRDPGPGLWYLKRKIGRRLAKRHAQAVFAGKAAGPLPD